MNNELDKLQNNEQEIPKRYSVMETLSQATKHKISEETSKSIRKADVSENQLCSEFPGAFISGIWIIFNNKNSGVLNNLLTIVCIEFKPRSEGDRSVNLRISFIYCK